MSVPLFRIAFLDDRKGPRESLLRGLQPALPDGWECVECPLLPSSDAYTDWLLDNDVLVLLVDQLLNEQAPDSDLPVDYKGHEVIRAIRRRLPEYPIIVVTVATEDHDLQHHLGDADDIVLRKNLLRDVNHYVQRFIRLGNKYLEEHQRELALMTELSRKSASGSAQQEEVEQLRALQAKLGLAFEKPSGRDAALSGLENELNQLDSLRNRVEAFLKQHGGAGARGSEG